METKTDTPFAANNLEPDAVIPGIPNADHVWQWGVRWEDASEPCQRCATRNPLDRLDHGHVRPAGHVDMWLASEDDARKVLRTTRAGTLVRRMVIQCPAEVVL